MLPRLIPGLRTQAATRGGDNESNVSEFPCRPRFTFGISSDGKHLYLYGAGFEIEVWDAVTLKLERVIDLQNDVTMGGIVVIP